MHLAKPRLYFSGEEPASHQGGNKDQWFSSAMPSQIGAKQKRGNTGAHAWRRLGDPPGLQFRDNREQPSFNLARGACHASAQGTLSLALLRTADRVWSSPRAPTTTWWFPALTHVWRAGKWAQQRNFKFWSSNIYRKWLQSNPPPARCSRSVR
ncbi:hypothetical protein CLAIMM_06373 isoform 2 [Cladophialophora immunda]|nr:hypothetical protein CLAIMM_06373 isoform 2 [Cladophialophora immunda]